MRNSFQRPYSRRNRTECACPGFGCIPATYMFVGISAGRLGGLRTGIPFTRDASGRILQRFLQRVGLCSSDEFSNEPMLMDCYLTNLVKGTILDSDGLNRAPSEEEILHWLPSIKREVKKVDPEVIVALGKIVTLYLERLFPGRVKTVRHPRWYQAHGALSADSGAFNQLVRDYCEILGTESRKF